jgi:thiol-disulfide isomerase/thioredoxin
MRSRDTFIVAIVGVALLGISVVWLGARHTHRAQDETANASSPEPAGEQTTIRFFRNPAAAPAFSATTIDGRGISLASLRGKVTIVNFWATWCPPCRAEIPDLIALQAKYRDRLQVIGISQDEEGVELVKRFAAGHDMNYPIVMATPELDKMFPGVAALPTSFVIDRDGRIVQKHVGMLPARLIEVEARALAGLPVNATIEEVDQTQGLKLDNGAQALNIPGVDLSKLSPAKRTEALEKLNAKPCTCGCDLTVARCRVDDPNCGISLPLARQIVAEVSSQPREH